jgi:hypothetical protein
MKKNSKASDITRPGMLVVYSGGGYSGCICEPNAYWVGFDGTFHCLLATGCAGVKEAWTEPDYRSRRAWRESSEGQRVLENLHGCVDVRSQADVDAMATDWLGETFVLEIMRRLDYVMGKQGCRDLGKLKLTCCICGGKYEIKDFLDARETIDAGFSRGGGGLMIHATDYLHEDCYYDNLCGGCGEFVDPREDSDLRKEFPTLLADERYQGLCDYCCEKEFSGDNQELMMDYNRRHRAMSEAEEAAVAGLWTREAKAAYLRALDKHPTLPNLEGFQTT